MYIETYSTSPDPESNSSLCSYHPSLSLPSLHTMWTGSMFTGKSKQAWQDHKYTLSSQYPQSSRRGKLLQLYHRRYTHASIAYWTVSEPKCSRLSDIRRIRPWSLVRPGTQWNFLRTSWTNWLMHVAGSMPFPALWCNPHSQWRFPEGKRESSYWASGRGRNVPSNLQVQKQERIATGPATV